MCAVTKARQIVCGMYFLILMPGLKLYNFGEFRKYVISERGWLETVQNEAVWSASLQIYHFLGSSLAVTEMKTRA
jgi:hypothetical protein